MSVSAHEAVVRRAIEAIWNRGDLDVADELFAADYVNHHGLISDLILGPEAITSYARRAAGQSPLSASASHHVRHASGRFVFRAMRSSPSTPSMRKAASRSHRSGALSQSSFAGRTRSSRFTHR